MHLKDKGYIPCMKSSKILGRFVGSESKSPVPHFSDKDTKRQQDSFQLKTWERNGHLLHIGRHSPLQPLGFLPLSWCRSTEWWPRTQGWHQGIRESSVLIGYRYLQSTLIRSEHQQNMPPQNMTVGSQDFPTQKTLLWYIDCFQPWELEKQQRQGEAFSKLPLLPKDRASKRSSVVTNPPTPAVSTTSSYHRRRDQKSTPHSYKLCHKLSDLPPILLRVHSSFLKRTYCPVRHLYPPSPFVIKMIFKLELEATSET